MLLRTQKFQYNVVYKRGTEMYLADTLSRAASGKPEQQTDHREAVFYTELEEINALQELAISEKSFVSLKQAMQEDATMNSLMKIILQGWPEEKKLLTLQCQDYFPYREELAINNGLVFKGHRVIVPER